MLQEGGSAGQAEKAKLNSESRIGRHTGSPDSDRAQIVTLHGFGLHAIGARDEESCRCSAIIELVTLGLDWDWARDRKLRLGNFARRAAARWNLVNSQRIGGKGAVAVNGGRRNSKP